MKCCFFLFLFWFFFELIFFFFQAEDGIRDLIVTGVQTCALPILTGLCASGSRAMPPKPRPAWLIARVGPAAAGELGGAPAPAALGWGGDCPSAAAQRLDRRPPPAAPRPGPAAATRTPRARPTL